MRERRRTLRSLPGLCGLLLLLAGAPRPSAALGLLAGHFTPAAGINWGEPLDVYVRDLYSGGVGFSAAVGYTLPPKLRAELRGGWLQRSASPPDFLASRSQSRLILMPVTLEAQFVLPVRAGQARPFLLAGPAVVFARERFTSALLSEAHESTGDETDWGAVAGIGFESEMGRVQMRLAGRAIITGGHRAVLRADGRTDSRGDTARSSLFVVGLEAALP